MPRLSIIMILKLLLVGISILLYLISLVSDAYYLIIPNETLQGFECLLLGWLSLFHNQVNLLPWISNFLFFACLSMGFFRITGYIAIPIGFIVILIAIPSFFITEFMYNEDGLITNAVMRYGAYLWFISYCILFASLLIPARWKKHTKPVPETQPDINSIP